jgi:5-(carboxyamino)imidazole ribonucleotide synthase
VIESPIVIEPGATIGILGGGQLGRMTALAAIALGYRCHVYCPIKDSPAKQATPLSTTADYDNKIALGRFAKSVDVITFEFENVPADTAELLAERKPVRPGPSALRIAQDRIKEKDFLRSIGVATAPYQAVVTADELRRAVEAIGPRAILKTTRMGYDGKGQVAIRSDSDLSAVWRGFGATDGILEAFVEFACEISVIIARGENGTTAAYAPVENQHVNHILDTTIAPARVKPEIATRAEAIAHHIAEKLDLVGLLAVEMFVTHAGEVLVNELAPRPHNSGHWTIDACYTSQFEQLVRAICGLPLGSPERHSDAVMKNLIGGDIEKWREAVTDPLQKVHLYGKDRALPGRKMGHVTKLSPRR